MAVRLVPDWRHAWTWLSMHAMAWSAAILLAYTSLPPAFIARVPEWAVNAIVAAVLVLGMVGRLVDQTPSNPSKPGATGENP